METVVDVAENEGNFLASRVFSRSESQPRLA